MKRTESIETIPCPLCGGAEHSAWAEERGFRTVRCASCRLLFVNPRPGLDSIDSAVRTGAHGDTAENLSVVARRLPTKVFRYRAVLGRLFDDTWSRGQPISWLDVGAGYGEVLEAVTRLASAGSRVEGLEPMEPKAKSARARGLSITQDYLRPTHPKVDVISVVDVFSHIPQFQEFLADLRQVLNERGEVFIETGNLADVQTRNEFPGELGLPDHLVFAGESQLRSYLERAGFEIVRLEAEAIDGWVNLAKKIVKKVLGRPVLLAWPYTSKYRQLLVRARLRPTAN